MADRLGSAVTLLLGVCLLALIAAAGIARAKPSAASAALNGKRPARYQVAWVPAVSRDDDPPPARTPKAPPGPWPGNHPPVGVPHPAVDARRCGVTTDVAGEQLAVLVKTSIVAGSLARGNQPFAHSGRPQDQAVKAEYEVRYGEFMEQVAGKIAALAPAAADPSMVSDEITLCVDLADLLTVTPSKWAGDMRAQP